MATSDHQDGSRQRPERAEAEPFHDSAPPRQLPEELDWRTVERVVRGVLRRRWNLVGDDLDDCVHEALASIVSAARTFRGEAKVTTWACSIALRVAPEWLRRRGPQTRAYDGESGADPSFDAEDVLVNEHLRRRLRPLVDRLPDRERRLVIGYFYEDTPMPALARQTGVSVATVSRTIARALRTLGSGLS